MQNTLHFRNHWQPAFKTQQHALESAFHPPSHATSNVTRKDNHDLQAAGSLGHVFLQVWLLRQKPMLLNVFWFETELSELVYCWFQLVFLV